jgi:hypothetical protein
VYSYSSAPWLKQTSYCDIYHCSLSGLTKLKLVLLVIGIIVRVRITRLRLTIVLFPQSTHPPNRHHDERPKTLSRAGLWPAPKAPPSSTLLICLCPCYLAINKPPPLWQVVCGWQCGTQGPDSVGTWCILIAHEKLASQCEGSVLSFVKRCSLELLLS